VSVTCDGPTPITGTADTTITVLGRPNFRSIIDKFLGVLGDTGAPLRVSADSMVQATRETAPGRGGVPSPRGVSVGMNSELTRGAAAAYLARALAGSDENVPEHVGLPSFTDVPADHWAFRHIEYVRSVGITDGLPNRCYHPELAVDRGQLAAFVARAVALRAGEDISAYVPSGKPTFNDVPATLWIYPYVEYLWARGLDEGRGDGTYRPDETCMRADIEVYLTWVSGPTIGDPASG
jgi:hypothetical protein